MKHMQTLAFSILWSLTFGLYTTAAFTEATWSFVARNWHLPLLTWAQCVTVALVGSWLRSMFWQVLKPADEDKPIVSMVARTCVMWIAIGGLWLIARLWGV